MTAHKLGGLQITTPSEREIAMTRVFDAPRRLVFEAHTRPELLKRWLGVFGDWSLAVCEIDLRVGGGFRYVWRKVARESDKIIDMGMRGTYREIVTNERIVSTEVFDDPWYEGTAVGTLTLVEAGGRTTLTSTILYDSQQIRDAVLKTPMEQGVSASYDKLAGILAESSVRP